MNIKVPLLNELHSVTYQVGGELFATKGEAQEYIDNYENFIQAKIMEDVIQDALYGPHNEYENIILALDYIQRYYQFVPKTDMLNKYSKKYEK